MRSEAIRLLKSLTQAHAVPGHEDEVRAIFHQELADKDSFGHDRLGSTYCELPGSGPRILVAGHMDEVGFRLQHILPNGYLKFVPLGGWWSHSLLSQRVEIKTADQTKIPGLIASKPPHFLPESERSKVIDLANLYIDIGASSRQEAESWGVRVGDPIAPLGPWTPFHQPDLFAAKAFDNRLGMAAAIQLGREIDTADLPCQLIVAGTVQEEVGLRGAKTLAEELQPDLVLILEGPPADDTPGMPPYECQGALGQGVQIRLQDPSAIMNPRLARFVQDLAESEGIPHQVTVRHSGGTDAGSFNTALNGLPCLVLGTPARYIHSHHALININDQISHLILLKSLLKKLTPATVNSFTNYQ
ncbi:MAG: M42 family metallopeptidase [Verrucomicrobiales bacterium]